jgi:hypothetical protein
MRKFCLLLLVLLILLAYPQSPARESGRRTRNLPQKVLGSPTWTKLNINHLSTNIWQDGYTDGNGNNPGFIYPKGSGIGAVYAAGLIWGARADTGNGTGDIRIGGSAYLSGLSPGRLLDSLKPESPDLPKNRIYRVRLDIPPGNSSADISSETADGEGDPQAIYDQYHKDWTEWPWQDGAPFDDKNKDGIYDPAIDVPGVPGADQTIWCVACDEPGPAMWPYYSPSLGMEIQTTYWGYRSEGALGYMYFRRYVLINRNSFPYDSMYVALWADVDLGNAGDDLLGCDTTRSIGFVYNGQETDRAYSPLPPPAVGFDFFQGPIVPGAPTDSAIFKGSRIHGKRNLPMTAFFANTNTSLDPVMKDPLEFSEEIYMYRALQGLLVYTGEPFVDPTNGLPTRYPFNGDPEKRTGWLDGTHGLTFGDRRMGVATGPFTMAPGDTQEIVVAEICAGAFLGCDRISAVGLLKFYDDQAQDAYDNFFAVPRAPVAPRVAVSPLNNEIVLEWGSDSAAVAATEVPAPLGYSFEGYNVYQLPSASASLQNSKRLVTFDVVNGVGKIIDLDFDPNQGSVFPTAKQYGTDSGIQRWLNIKTDAYNNNYPLVNGTPYYFAVTAYNYNSKPGLTPSTLESSPVILTVMPHSPDPGTRYGGHSGDSIAPVIHTTVPGLYPSDGTVLPLIIDPSRLTGHQYAVTFDTVTGSVTWRLTDVTTGVVKLSKQENQSGDQHYLAVDGIQTIVSGPLPGMAAWQIPSGTRRFTWAGGDAYGLEGFNGAMENSADFYQYTLKLGPGFGVPHYRLKNVLLKLAPAKADGTFPIGDEDVSYAYRYLRAAQQPPAKPEFAPYIVNASASYAFQDYVQGIPFSAWNVEVDPPQRLAVAFLENNVDTGRVDGKWWPDLAYVDNCSANSQREWFWVLDAPYTGTIPDPAFQTNALTDPNIPFMWISLANRRADVNWATGDEFMILANHINWPGNSFSFTAPTNVIGDEALAKDDVSQINVFPNPYYGVNPQELNKYQRFVTFNHLPRKATIRIFNLAGVMVRTINRESDSQFEQWDLKNDSNLPVGSGLYIAYIEMPDVQATKIIKIAIVQEQQILDRY